jgi:hypothetical protein
MTVRINKDAINLREKLSELDKPSGLVGEELLRADTSADAREALNLEEHLFEDFESTGIDDNATSTAITVDTSGNVGIGTASPNFDTGYGGIHISDSAPSIHLTPINTGTTSDDGYAINVNSLGIVKHINKENQSIEFHTNNTERARIDRDGNLLVGKTAISYDTAGVELREDGRLIACRDGGTVTIVSRNTTDGVFTQYRKDGVPVGSIGVLSGYLTVGKGDTGLLFNDGANQIQPHNSTTNTSIDAAINIGSGSSRFKDLYLSGGVITSSDYRLKDDIQPMQSYADTVKQMNLVNFAWKDSGEREDGFIAHELQALVPSAVRGEKDAVGEDGNEQYQGVDPLKLIPILTKALQEALERIETLENK